MKSIKEPLVKKKEQEEYPCLKIFLAGGKLEEFIVFFSSTKVGTVVWRAEAAQHKLATHKHDWITSNFVPFKGRVILEE